MQKPPLKLLPAGAPLEAAQRNERAAAKSYRNDRLLSPALRLILQEVQRELGARDGGDEHLPSDEELRSIVSAAGERCGFELSSFERDQVVAEIERDRKPFGILQPLVDDGEISDIIVTNYAKITVQQGRRNFQTDLGFVSPEGYEAFVERLLVRAGSSYSTKAPIADGIIGGYARVHAVHKCLCESGPYLTIRLNRFSTVGLRELADAGMAPPELLAYMRVLVRAGRTVLIAGEVGTGKTTLARALASSIPADESILVIEDTPEIRLEHPHVRYITTRDANTDGEGRVAPSACIRGGMRMAMNRIIFGEIRDAEAAEAFVDVCASGHPGLSTIHARSAGESLTRLELFLGRAQRGLGREVMSEQIATAVQAVVFVDFCRATLRRRVKEVVELGGTGDGAIRQRPIARYESSEGVPRWRLVQRASLFRSDLESGADPITLSALPELLELAPEVAYRECVRGRHG